MLSHFCIVCILEISIFQAVAKEKHWLLGTFITLLIQRIAHDLVSLDQYLYEYQDMLRPDPPLYQTFHQCHCTYNNFKGIELTAVFQN